MHIFRYARKKCIQHLEESNTAKYFEERFMRKYLAVFVSQLYKEVHPVSLICIKKYSDMYKAVYTCVQYVHTSKQQCYSELCGTLWKERELHRPPAQARGELPETVARRECASRGRQTSVVPGARGATLDPVGDGVVINRVDVAVWRGQRAVAHAQLVAQAGAEGAQGPQLIPLATVPRERGPWRRQAPGAVLLVLMMVVVVVVVRVTLDVLSVILILRWGGYEVDAARTLLHREEEGAVAPRVGL